MGVLMTPCSSMATRARVTVDRLRVGIMIDGHQTTFSRSDVQFKPDRPGRLAVRVRNATLYFRPDRPADCRWLTKTTRDAGSRLPLLGLEGAASATSQTRSTDAAGSGPHPADCDWVVRTNTHGIVRRVCRYCNAVSIDLTAAERAVADPYAASATNTISS
jgi:hypothetical protein